MLKTLGIVQASFRSPRFRANVSRRLGGRSLLEWTIRRMTESQRLDGVIVVACDAVEHRDLCKMVPMDVPVFAGDHPDMLTRFVRALEQYPAESVIRVHGDNPFLDPGLIDRLVNSAQADSQCDYVSFRSRDGRPAILSPVGIYGEWFTARALRRASRLAKTPADREEVTGYLYSHPERFHVRLVPAPPQMDRDDVRLTIQNDEDWDHTLAIYEALGPESLDWQRIAELLDHQPALRRRMAAMNRARASA